MKSNQILSVRASVFTYELPPERQLVWAGGRIERRDNVFVRVETRDGRVGWGEIGEAYLYPRLYADLVNNRVGEALLGRDATQIERIQADLHVFLLPLGAGGLAKSVISGIDIALHDLRGESAAPEAPAPVAVYASTGFHPTLDGLRQECERALAAGFRTLKFRGAVSVADDIRRIQAARDAVGHSVDLVLELSQPYVRNPYDFPQIVRICEAARDAGLLWVEEPFRADDVESYRRLRELDLTAVAAGENLYTEREFRTFAQALDVFQPDLTRVGGLTGLRRIAPGCARLAPHQFGTSVALAALCRYAQTTEQPLLIELDTLPNPVRDILFGAPLEVAAGRLELAGLERHAGRRQEALDSLLDAAG